MIIRLKDTLSHSQYFFGDVNEVAGKTLRVLERNKRGDCLCIVGDKGLMDVDHRDIAEGNQ